MNGFLTIVKKNKIEVLAALILNFNQFFLFDNFILGFLSIIANLTLSFLFLRKRDSFRNQLETELSAYSFFLSLLDEMEKGTGSKSAYDSSCRYLTGYQNYNEFETEAQEPSLNLFKMEKYYHFLLKKDQDNEAKLLHFRPLIKSTEAEIERIHHIKQREERRNRLSFISLLLFSLFFSILFSFLSEYDLSSSFLYIGVTFIYTILDLPLLLLVEKENYRGNCHVR